MVLFKTVTSQSPRDVGFDIYQMDSEIDNIIDREILSLIDNILRKLDQVEQ